MTIEDYIIHNYTQTKTWKEFTEELNFQFGTTYSANAIKKRYYRLRNHAIKSSDDVNSKIVLEKLKAQARDERNQINALIRRAAREDTIKELANSIVSNINPKKYDFCVDNCDKFLYNKKGRDAILVISDWHYGYSCATVWNTFNVDVAKERINKLLNSVLNYIKIDAISNLHVVNLGDLISGRIHAPLRINNQIDVITQVVEVSELLSNFLAELCRVTNVFYYDTLDNHSRIEPIKENSIELESLARVITECVKLRLKDAIKINPVTFAEDIILFNIENYTIAATHGHNDRQSSIIKDITQYVHTQVDLILSGHYHHFSADEDNNTMWICSGSLMGTDDYANSRRLHSVPSQNLIILGTAPNHNVCETLHKIILN